MRYQFAAGRQQLPFTSGAIAVTSGGSTTSTRTLYFALVGETPGGFNLLSSIVGPIEVEAGEKVVITLPTSARLAGEFWENFVIAASATNTPSSFVQLCKVPAIDSNGDPVTLPIIQELDSDGDLELPGVVPTPAELPGSPLNGQLRSIASLGGDIFEFVQGDSRTANGTTILTAIGGRWLLRPGSFSAYIASTTVSGCDRPLELVPSNLLRAPRYAMGGANGRLRTYWLVNTGSDAIPAGRRVGFNIKINGEPRSELFDGLLMTRFRGYADIATGLLRTTYADSPSEPLPLLNVERPYRHGRASVVLPDDLESGEAFAIAVYPRFAPYQTLNQVGQLSTLEVSPILYGQEGVYTEAGEAFGNWVYPTEDRRLIVPGTGMSLRALKGSGIVNSLVFDDVGPGDFTGLQANTADQVVAINGNGAVYVTTTFDENREAKRAIASCEAGVTDPSPWSSAATLGASRGVRLTLTHPVSGGFADIRSDYPDPFVAGLAGKARLNAPLMNIFVEAGGEIRRFSNVAVVNSATQQVDLFDWSGGTVVTSVPGRPESEFGLFAPVSSAIAANGVGDFPAGSVRACFQYVYSGSQVTAISHVGGDLIHTASMPLSDIEASAKSWGPMVVEADIEDIPQSRTFPQQRRYTATGRLIYFDPLSLREANGATVWRPAWRTSLQPGRWLLDPRPTLADILPLIIGLGG